MTDLLLTEDENKQLQEMIDTFKSLQCIKYANGMIRYTNNEQVIKQASEEASSISAV